MKKTILILLALCMVLAMAGCSGSAKTPVKTAEATQTQTPAPTVSAPSNGGSSSAIAGTPSESFSKYMDAKGKAYDRISDKIEDNDELSLSVGLTILPITMVDLTLIPLTVVGLDNQAGISALQILGMQNATISQNGSVYTITYKDNDGNTMTQTCEYDQATDSMRSVIKDSKGKEAMFFEYVKVGKGYASQYYMLDDQKNTYSLITSFFDESNVVAFGIASAKKEPTSIFKNAALTKDFVVNKEAYFILENNKLSVLEKGKVKVY